MRWAADEKTATVYSADKAIIVKLDKLCKEYPELYQRVRQDEDGSTYRMDRKMVVFKKPRKYSEEQLEKMRENALKIQKKSF